MWKRLVCVIWMLMCMSASPGHPLSENTPLSEYDRQDPGHYLNMFLVQVDDQQTAERVARDNGFVLVEKLSELDMYLLNHPEVSGRSKRSAEDYVSKLKTDSRVKFVEQQITLRRVKRTHEVLHDKQLEFPIREIKDNSKYYRNMDKFDTRDSTGPLFNDKYFSDQWYLLNEEQTGGKRNIDLNVVKAWEQGFTGSGVVVTTLDDGIDHDHPDIRNNYDPEASADMNDRSDTENDPTPDKSSRGNSHGTRCAGEIAAEAGNGFCGVGVAFHAKIGGIRILDGRITDELEALALLYNNQHVDIYSASWGPHDDGETMEGPKKACTKALKRGVETGRGGKGSIYVWATGNGGSYEDNCGADGYVSSPESISVQSLTDHGDMPFFGEKCCSTMIAVPTGGEATQSEEMKAQYKIKVVTTDIDGGCVENFEGTSSAAPLASGCYALVLQANPELTWRDVQHVTVEAARISYDDSMWTINGAGYHVNTKFGFGMMDCTRMVELAQGWTNKPAQHTCETSVQMVNKEITSSSCYKITYQFDGCQGDAAHSITHLEHVQLGVKASSGKRGHVEIFLESPSGTRSKLLARRSNDDNNEDIDFTFMTVHSWMENPMGEWTIEVCDNPGTESTAQNTIQFHSWYLRAFGFHENNEKSTRSGKASTPSSKTVQEIMKREFKVSRSVSLKRAQTSSKLGNEVDKKQEWDKFSSKADKIFQSIGHLFGTRSLENFLNNKNKFDNRNYDSNNFVNNKYKNNINDVEDDDENVNALKREVLNILSQMDDREVKTYVEKYLEHQRELERERRIQKLVSEIETLLKNKK